MHKFSKAGWLTCLQTRYLFGNASIREIYKSGGYILIETSRGISYIHIRVSAYLPSGHICIYIYIKHARS